MLYFVNMLLQYYKRLGGQDSTPVRGVPYEPLVLYSICRAKFESIRSESWCWVRSWSFCWLAGLATGSLLFYQKSDDDDKAHETEAFSIRIKDWVLVHKDRTSLARVAPQSLRAPSGHSKQSFTGLTFRRATYVLLSLGLPSLWYLPTYGLPDWPVRTLYLPVSVSTP